MSTAVSSATGTSSSKSATSATTSSSTLGKDDFLQLMITQMKYQDPLDPMDNTQYASQLAQFSSLEQMSNINTNLTTSLNAQYALNQSINNSMSASMIGKDVKVSSTDLTVTKDQKSIDFGYDLAANAKSSTLTITNSAGKVVKSVDLTEVAQGEHEYTWDMTNDKGVKVAAGSYTYSITSKASDGTALTTNAYRIGKISSIRFTSSGTMAVVDGCEFSISDITEISDGG